MIAQNRLLFTVTLTIFFQKSMDMDQSHLNWKQHSPSCYVEAVEWSKIEFMGVFVSDQLMLFVYLTWQIKMCPFRKNHNIFWVNTLKLVLTQCCIHFAICPTLHLNQHNFVGMHFQISMRNCFTFRSNNGKYTSLPQQWLLNWTFHCSNFSGPVAVCRHP